MRRVFFIAVPIATLAAAALAFTGGSSGDTRLTLVAYSTPRGAYAEIIPAFRETGAGGGASFEQSYGSSGEQTRAVLGGLKADVVALSLEPDVAKLVEAGLVDGDWKEGPSAGMVTNSLVVFVVRPGNPKGIRTWDDLIRPGVDVVTPNPFTSGGARWNVMAAYGAWVRSGAGPGRARAKLERLFRNVVAQDKSARESLQTFSSGRGDVLLAYENEALFAQSEGEELEFVIPPATILIENPVAVVAGSEHASRARAFVDFLLTPAAQRIFAENGYRPVDDTVAREFRSRFPEDTEIFTIGELGGWPRVQDRFFDTERGVMAHIQRAVGGSLE
jgi:sulfate/thiosulfate transport system substrate-binding protein